MKQTQLLKSMNKPEKYTSRLMSKKRKISERKYETKKGTSTDYTVERKHK